jgi:hypothetical protein
VTFLLWSSAVALIGIVLRLVIGGIVETALDYVQRAEHEQFWNDGKTNDGSWARSLRERWGDAVVVDASVTPSAEALKDIRPRDSLGRRIPPHRLKARNLR